MSRYTSAHAAPQGPGDARPTALQIVHDNHLTGALTGKVALITGTSSGIGIETARALKATGMRVFGAVRNIAKATAALKDDLEPGRLELLQLDMDSLASVRACAADLLSKTDALHLLITNAGTMMQPAGTTADGFELTFGTNHLAHFLLFQLLAPTLLASATPDSPARVVALSSVAHRGSEIDFETAGYLRGAYDPVAAYAQSKLANVYMASEIERRYGARNLHAFSVMPGGIWTGMQAGLPEEVVAMWKADAEFQKGWKNAEQGAATTMWAAVEADVESAGGKYLEDCAVAGPAPPPTGTVADVAAPGYAPFAYDEEKAGRLWKVSCGLVGVEEEA